MSAPESAEHLGDCAVYPDTSEMTISDMSRISAKLVVKCRQMVAQIRICDESRLECMVAALVKSHIDTLGEYKGIVDQVAYPTNEATPDTNSAETSSIGVLPEKQLDDMPPICLVQ